MKKTSCIFFVGIMMILLCSCGINTKKKSSLRIIGFNISHEQEALIEKYKDNHPDVEIEIVDYSQYGDRQSGLQRLNADIMGKNVGDVLIANTLIPIDSYIDKGILWDLQNIEEFDDMKKTILPSVLRSCEKDGGIYSIFPEFSIYCFVGKKELISEELWNSQSICDVFEPFAQREINIFSGQSISIYQELLVSMLQDDIQKKNGLTQDANYLRFMEVTEKLVEIADMSENVQLENDALYRNDKIPLSVEYIDNFDSYYRLQKVKYNSDIVLLGYPGEDNKPLFDLWIEFSIFNSSENKDLAWEFISYYLGREYQYSYLQEDSIGFPVNKEIFQKMYDSALMDKAMDEDGNYTIEKEYIYFIGGKEVDLGIPSKEDLQPLIDTIDSMKCIRKFNMELQNIIDGKMDHYWLQPAVAMDIYSDIKYAVELYIEEKR